jgi:hypothetical protein
MVKNLKRHKYAWPFTEPVNPLRLNIPDYHIYVPLPMDLSTVEGKLLSQSYRNMSDFANDIRLIWSNTETYNGPDHLVTTMAHQLREIFERMLDHREKFWREYLVKIPYTKRRIKPRPYPSVFKNCTIKKSGRKTSNSMKSNTGTPVQSSSSSKTQSNTRSPSTPTVSPVGPLPYPNSTSANTPHSQQIMTYNIPPPVIPSRPSSSQRRSSSSIESPNSFQNNTGGGSSASKYSGVSRGTSGPMNYAINYAEIKQSALNVGAPNVVGPQNQNVRSASPVVYIRIYFEKTIIKTNRNSLASLRVRLRECFKMNNFRLHYLDEDEITRIEVLDEKCFNIFLLSNVKKNLYMEKSS